MANQNSTKPGYQPYKIPAPPKIQPEIVPSGGTSRAAMPLLSGAGTRSATTLVLNSTSPTTGAVQASQNESVPGGLTTINPYLVAESSFQTLDVLPNNITIVTASRQWTQGDFTVEIDTTAQDVVYYLPSYVGFYGTLTFAWVNGSNPAIVAATNSETIDGQVAITLAQKYYAVTVTPGSSGWLSTPNVYAPVNIAPFVNGDLNSGFSVNWSNSVNQFGVLNSNCALQFVSGTSGSFYTIELQQASSGGPYTVTWPTSVKFGNISSTLTTTASHADMFVFLYNHTGSYVAVAHNSGYAP